MEKVDTIQKAMDAAYAEWREHEDWNYADFIFNIGPVERRAVALGNLNYQVNNGGFMQWIDNGYAKDSKHVLRVIAREIDNKEGYAQLKAALKLAIAAPSELDDGLYDDEKATDAFYELDTLADEMNQYIASLI